jgi:hypothetical protein
VDQKPIRATPGKLADRSTRVHRAPDAVPAGQTADLWWKEGAISREEAGRDFFPPGARNDPMGAWREGPVEGSAVSTNDPFARLYAVTVYDPDAEAFAKTNAGFTTSAGSV